MKSVHLSNYCLLPGDIIMAADFMCGEQFEFEITPRHLNCLSIVLEAFLLYDKVLTYNYYGVLPYTQKWRSPILMQQQQEYIKWVDPYKDLSLKDRAELAWRLILSTQEDSIHEFIEPHVAFGYRPDMATRLKASNLANLDSAEFTKLVSDALPKIFNSPKEMKLLPPENQWRIILSYLWEQLQRIDQMRMLGARYKIAGSFLDPDWEPFWQYERTNVRFALHEKFKQAEEAMLKTHLVENYSAIDVSPLVVVALSKTKSPEGLPETIKDMRIEYSELRSAGSKYAKMLGEAETYGEAEHVVREWSEAWEALLKRIASHSKPFPLIRKLFSWDVLKRLSARSFFLDSVETVLSEFRNLTITKKLWVVGRLEKQFLKSRLIEKRIKELYRS